MQLFFTIAYRLSQLGAFFSALALIGMTCLIGYEILLRFFFSTSTFVLDEFVGYCLAICVVWSLGYTLEHEAMIRVDLVTQRLSEKVQSILMAISAFVTAFFVVGLAWFYFERAGRAWERGTVSYSVAEVPVWIPEMLMVTGLVIFSLQLIAYGLRQLTNIDSIANIEPSDFVE